MKLLFLLVAVPVALLFIAVFFGIRYYKEKTARVKAEQEVEDLILEKKWMQEAHEQNLAMRDVDLVVDERGKIAYTKR